MADVLGPQFQITNFGPPEDLDHHASFADVAYNTATEQHLVVFVGSTTASTDDIYGQFVDATGANVGAPFPISQADTGNDANNPPTVAYSPELNEWLVTWASESDQDVLVQRLAANGALVGTERTIATLQNDIETTNVVWSGYSRQWLVVWKGESSSVGRVRGQLLAADSSPAGGTLHIIGSAALNTNDAVGVAYNDRDHQYLVVTRARPPAAEEEYEIYGQRLAIDGSQIGADDFRISDLGPDGNSDFFVQPPSVAWNSRDNQYLVTWSGEDDTPPLVDDELEVHGQRLSSDGGEIGANDFRISRMGADGNTEAGAFRARLTYNPDANQYLVTWHGDTVVTPLVADEYEVYGQDLAADGAPIGAPQFRISTSGPAGNPDGSVFPNAVRPTAAYNPATCDYLVVWTVGDVDDGNDEFEWELFGRRAAAPACPPVVPPADTTDPVISALTVAPKAIAARASLLAAKKPARSTTLSYTLSEDAEVKIALERRTRGRRVGGKCRKQTKSNRTKRACARFVRARTLTQAGKEGKNQRKVKSKQGRKRLKAGRYRAVLQATDLGGNVSTKKSVRFRVVKPPKKKKA